MSESELAAAAAAAAAARIKAESDAAASVAINSVTIKLPVFYTSQVELWFLQAEAQFSLRSPKISTQEQRYFHVLAALPEPVASSIKAHLQSPIWSTCYDDLKAELLQRYVRTKWQLADDLLHHPGIGDRRPSALYADMANQLPAGEPAGILFQALFLSRLPPDIRAHLVAQDFDTPRLMAAHADRLWDSRQSAAVSSIAVDAFSSASQVNKVSSQPASTWK